MPIEYTIYKSNWNVWEEGEEISDFCSDVSVVAMANDFIL